MWFFSNIATDRVENIYLNFESGENKKMKMFPNHTSQKSVSDIDSQGNFIVCLRIEKKVFIAHMSIS